MFKFYLVGMSKLELIHEDCNQLQFHMLPMFLTKLKIK
jgi:hypothetical protein